MQGWRQFRTLIEAKCAKYDREFIVISRWEPTSQKCSVCGFRGGKKKLDVREWKCINCGAVHDRDINAAINILNTGSKTKTSESQPVINTEVSLVNDNVVQLDLLVKIQVISLIPVSNRDGLDVGLHLKNQLVVVINHLLQNFLNNLVYLVDKYVSL